MKVLSKSIVALLLLILAGGLSCAQAVLPPLTPKNVPPLAIAAGAGLTVDSYDHGNYFGAFHDDKGSTLTVDSQPYADGKSGKFLFGSFSLVPGGYVGMWAVPGEKWNNKQDWSQAKTITFDAYSSKPMTFSFTFKGDNGLKYTGAASTTKARVWQKLTIPVASLTDIASQIGLISGFDLNIHSSGSGQFALDNLMVEGGQAQALGDNGQPLEMRGSVIFAKTLVPPTQRSHKTCYVDQSIGKDTGPGTQAQPWATLQKAADALLPGDTVLVKNGTYFNNANPHQTAAVITKSGAPGAVVTFRALPGQHPVAAFSVTEAAYVTIDGFDVTTHLPQITDDNQKEGYGIGLDKSHHIRILHCTVHDCGGGGIGTGYCDYVTIAGNTVHDNAFRSIYNCSGISLWECRAFDDKPGYHDIVRGNVCYRNENKGPTPLYGGELTDGNGIILDWQRGVAPVLIENNICYDNGGRGIHLFHSKHVLVRNNTLVGNERTHGAGGCDLRAGNSDDVQFVGNIVVGRAGQKFADNYQSSHVVYTQNLFYNYVSVDPAELGTGNIIGKDPLFVNGAPVPGQADFRLRAGSPAVRMGAEPQTARTVSQR